MYIFGWKIYVQWKSEETHYLKCLVGFKEYILGTWFKYLFPRDRKEYSRENWKLHEGLERKYKIKEGSLISGFTQYSKDYVYYYRMIKDNYTENGQCEFYMI
jgi:hypothetical protein